MHPLSMAMIPLACECLPCMVGQARRAADLVHGDVVQKLQLTGALISYLHGSRMEDLRTVENHAHAIIRRCLGGDPYRAARRASTAQALAMYPRLQACIAASPDPLETAVRIAAAGNAIDLAACAAYDLDEALRAAMEQPLVIDHLDDFRRTVFQAGALVYLGDNAGEAVFDRLLIETLGLPVTFVVKGGPSINDVLLEDAHAAGLDRVAPLVSNGTDWIGTHLPALSPACRELLENAPLILAKGQANLMTLIDFEPPAGRCFFLLKVKCQPVARLVGAPPGSHVLI